MKEIRIHARAGQGAITTATILGQAYFMNNKYAYAFPHFGAARMGAPMNAFVRVDDNPIRLRSQVTSPDYLIVVDPTLMRGFDCYTGFKSNGIAVINTREGLDIPKPKDNQKIYLLPANDIALKIIGRPLGNTVLLGAYAAATGEIELDGLIQAVEKRFSGKIAQMNIEAAKAGYEYIKPKK
ncbi:MAG: pyruvate ferredoxin oxidoreductase [Candidatus Omnitrophica bacterium CG11_big_fil_rev_8_21_14_0_20_42_13]|uniref:Pyruvate ferredoxin oxidoreductase n=1 Tax=Candidatus Ghiorseimicrobium undicola TaxID=1974746 RepID=A0A2H0LZD9_9BACT|nr:MAG: pyruvate ferredoxin oxidoreductase [Candidatus Omnitrophica bacterium CG11_big_fil_rev_8_21_14_0_20_42_13]